MTDTCTQHEDLQCPCQLHAPWPEVHLFRKRTALCSKSRSCQVRISSLWREREREGGGGEGLKGSAHFALKILVWIIGDVIKAGPLDLSFWSFLSFLHYGIEDVERHLLWKFHNKIQRKSWSNVPPKLLACIRFLYKVVHKNGRLRKFNRAREIEFNFFIAWTIFMKRGTLVHHVHGYKLCLRFFNFCLGT